MLFGTFKNPSTFSRECGFDGEREERLKDMLRGRNVLRSDAYAAAPRWVRHLILSYTDGEDGTLKG